MLTDKEKEVALKHLGIFRRQKQKYELYIEETNAEIEELKAQLEQLPNNLIIQEALQHSLKNLQNFETQHDFLLLKIEAVETSL